MTSKIVYDKEWIKTNMTSKRFGCTGHCEVCNQLTVDWMWYSIKNGVSRCSCCFTPIDAR